MSEGQTRISFEAVRYKQKEMYLGKILYHCVASYPDSEVFINPNSTSPSFGAISFFSSLTTCAWRGPLLMSFRNFCRDSSVPWASPSTCMVLVKVSYLILTQANGQEKKQAKCQMQSKRDSTHPSTVCVLHPAFYIICSGSLLSKVPIDRGVLSEKCIYSVQKAGYSYRNPTPARICIRLVCYRKNSFIDVA